VHEQPAGVLLLAVPAAEVVGAVGGVEQPLEVHRGDVTDLPGGDEGLERAVARGVAVVEGHQHVPAGALDRVRDATHPVLGRGQRLLDDGVRTGLQGGDDVVGVEDVRGGDDDPVDPEPADGLPQVRGREPLRGSGSRGDEAAGVDVQAARVGVAHGDELPVGGVVTGQGPEVHRPGRNGDEGTRLPPR
jgi:hypothetical protein